MILRVSRPADSLSTRKAVIPRLPNSGSTVANTSIHRQVVALETQVFCPVSRKPSPSRLAAVRIAAASLPASGSVIPTAAVHSPAASGLR